MDPQPRTFTRDEAQALLPEVDRLLGEAQTLVESMARVEEQFQARQWKPRANGKVNPAMAGDASEADRRGVVRQLQQLIDQLHAKGIVVRDIRTGLVDFPSLREGRIVNLCWRRGEPLEIRWWHEVEVGFGGRQPL